MLFTAKDGLQGTKEGRKEGGGRRREEGRKEGRNRAGLPIQNGKAEAEKQNGRESIVPPPPRHVGHLDLGPFGSPTWWKTFNKFALDDPKQPAETKGYLTVTDIFDWAGRRKQEGRKEGGLLGAVTTRV